MADFLRRSTTLKTEIDDDGKDISQQEKSRLYHDLALILDYTKATTEITTALVKDLQANDWYCKLKVDDEKKTKVIFIGIDNVDSMLREA